MPHRTGAQAGRAILRRVGETQPAGRGDVNALGTSSLIARGGMMAIARVVEWANSMAKPRAPSGNLLNELWGNASRGQTGYPHEKRTPSSSRSVRPGHGWKPRGSSSQPRA